MRANDNRTTTNCFDRRTALETMLLATGGLALQLLQPMEADAKSPGYYPIIFKLKGGKNPNRQIRRVRRGASIAVSRLKKPTRKGYRFVSWHSDKKLEKKACRVYGRAAKQKRTLYAKWKPISYTIAYSLSGGRPTLPLPKRYTILSPKITPFKPVQDGYRFVGWYADRRFKKSKPSISSGSTGNVRLYAKWAPTAYWKNHLQSKCAAVKELARDEGIDMPSFVFISDMHLPSNALVSPDLVRKVMASTNTDMVVFGGDAIGDPTSKADAMGMLAFIRDAFQGYGEVHFVRGNHDGNNQGVNANAKTAITAAEFLKITAGPNEIRQGNSLYYYRDNAPHRVRFIFLDSGEPEPSTIGDEQVDWLKERILELDESWTALVFVHQFFTSVKTVDGVKRGRYNSKGRTVERALDSIFDEAKASIAGVIAGHCHRDYSQYSAKGYPIVITTCDAYKKAKPEEAPSRKIGTLGEQAFDIVTLDTSKNTLYFTRIGLGEDRVFTYEPSQLSQSENLGTSEPVAL